MEFEVRSPAENEGITARIRSLSEVKFVGVDIMEKMRETQKNFWAMFWVQLMLESVCVTAYMENIITEVKA